MHKRENLEKYAIICSEEDMVITGHTAEELMLQVEDEISDIYIAEYKKMFDKLGDLSSGIYEYSIDSANADELDFIIIVKC